MGVSGSAKSRIKRARVNALVEKIAVDAAAEEAQRNVLGTVVSGSVPDGALFVEDRIKPSREERQEQKRAQLRNDQRSRRRIPKPRKSEHALQGNIIKDPLPVPFRGKKVRQGKSTVDMQIIAKRFKHISSGKISGKSAFEQSKSSREDLWESELAKDVALSKSKFRHRIEEKMNFLVRSKAHVLPPDDGASVNPLHEAHQDALGEVIAEEISRDDVNQWTIDSLTVDPAVLREPDIQVADDESDDGVQVRHVFSGVLNNRAPERKTRRDRNRESRRRVSEARRLRKISHLRISKQIDRIEEIDAAAKAAVRKLEGRVAAARKRRREKLKAKDGVAVAAAEPLHKSLAGVRVPSEKDRKTVPLSEDLAKDLRSVGRPVVNPLIRERFVGFQRRGLIEPSPAVAKELVQAEKDRVREERRDKMIRKGRGSRSKLTYWRKPRKR